MEYNDNDEFNFFNRDNSNNLLKFEIKPFDLLIDHKYYDSEINCSDYLKEGLSNEIETQSNSNSEKKSSPKSGSRDITNSINKVKSGFMDFEENLVHKIKKKKKYFKVITRDKNLIESNSYNKTKDESLKNTQGKEIICNEYEIVSKFRIMKIKRSKQKKLLEMTRGFKRIYFSENVGKCLKSNDCLRKESIRMKKKAVQNRISAQKSIEKKKNIMNKIKIEKESLTNENYHLKLELEKKNLEIDFLKAKLNSISNPYSNYPKSNIKMNLISASILLICLILLIFDHSSDGEMNVYTSVNLSSSNIFSQRPILKYSRRKVSITNNNDKTLFRVSNEIRLFGNIKQKLNKNHLNKTVTLNSKKSYFEFCLNRFKIFDDC